MNLLPYGPAAWLVEVDEADVIGYAAAVLAHPRPEIAEVVPAARTVLVRLRAAADRNSIAAWLTGVRPQRVADDPPAPIEVAVRYDGPDLDSVARAAGCSTDEVISRHHGAVYSCAFCGFAPGFAYLRGLDPQLVLPRRATPRTRVPAGAVAIADTYSAVYPSASPGGWHLIGTTDASLWNPHRREPALIRPGSVVRFVPR